MHHPHLYRSFTTHLCVPPVKHDADHAPALHQAPGCLDALQSILEFRRDRLVSSRQPPKVIPGAIVRSPSLDFRQTAVTFK